MNTRTSGETIWINEKDSDVDPEDMTVIVGEEGRDRILG